MLNVVIFVESVVHRSNWRSRETETVGNSRKQSETVGNSRERPGVIMPKLSIRNFFAKKNTFRAIPFFFESATGNSWKQLGLVPLTRQKTSYLKSFKVHVLYKLLLNSCFFCRVKGTSPNCFQLFPVALSNIKWDCAESFFLQKNGGLTILA